MGNVFEHGADVSPGEYHDENTLLKVRRGLMSVGLSDLAASDAIGAMLNEGVLFRERLETSTTVDRRPHSRACGIHRHDHGFDCHSDCPTCGGRPI